MQFMLIDYNAELLYNDASGDVWQDLIDNKQKNYYADDDDDDDNKNRRLNDMG